MATYAIVLHEASVFRNVLEAIAEKVPKRMLAGRNSCKNSGKLSELTKQKQIIVHDPLILGLQDKLLNVFSRRRR